MLPCDSYISGMTEEITGNDSINTIQPADSRMDLLSYSNKPSASLTSLPAELRLLIYQHLFRATKIVISPAGGGGYSNKARKSKSNTTEKGTWPILLTCRAIYAEAMPSYWTHAHLKFYGTWRQLPDVCE